MDENLIITKKSAVKGEDGYKTCSIRIKDATAVKLDRLSEKTYRSRNELINILLDWALERSQIQEPDKKM